MSLFFFSSDCKDTFFFCYGQKKRVGRGKNGFIDEDIDEEQTTGIRNVDALSPADRARQNVWYTLSGSRLPDKPTEPGIYINNGRKIVIK